jgi:FtsH-binding integral membrane protein
VYTNDQASGKILMILMVVACILGSLVDAIICFYWVSIFKHKLLLCVYMGLCVLIFSIVLIIDIWLMVKTDSLKVDDYLIGATIIYIDIIKVFAYLLCMLKRN